MRRGTRRLSVKNSDIPNQHPQPAHYTSFMMPYKKNNQPVGQMRRGTRRLSVKNSDIPTRIIKRHITLRSWCPTKPPTTWSTPTHPVGQIRRGTRRLSVKNSDIPNPHHQPAHYALLMMPYEKTNIIKRHITLRSWCPTKPSRNQPHDPHQPTRRSDETRYEALICKK